MSSLMPNHSSILPDAQRENRRRRRVYLDNRRSNIRVRRQNGDACIREEHQHMQMQENEHQYISETSHASHPKTSTRGDELEYTSWDSVIDDVHNLYQPEFLNSLCPSGLPPNKLILKVGCPVMLLRNLDPQMGLCNGTRLICRNLSPNFIDAEIITGNYCGTRVFLHHMPLNSEDDSGLPFVLKRIKFPVRVSFALTINKAQGQTIPNVGIFLRNHVFGQGQLYVSLSRGISEHTTKILVKNGKFPKRQGVFTMNVVYKEVLLPTT